VAESQLKIKANKKAIVLFRERMEALARARQRELVERNT
jgi:hypothetical protein